MPPHGRVHVSSDLARVDLPQPEKTLMSELPWCSCLDAELGNGKRTLETTGDEVCRMA